MARRFQSGHSIIFPVPAALQVDGGPLTLLVVAKLNTSAYQAAVYTRSVGAHAWWMEYDLTGGLHLNYGTNTTPRNCGTVSTGAWAIHTGRKDAGGSVHPFGRHFTGSFATDGGDVDSGSTLVDGTAADASYGLQFGRWGNTGTDYSGDLELAFFAAWTSLVAGSTLAGLTKTKAGILLGSPTYWASFEGSTVTDSVGGTPTITGTTATSDPTGFFGSGLTQALPVATETNTAITLGRSKARALPVAGVADTAVALGRSKARPLPVASETAAAVTVGRSKARALPPATESSTAVAPAGKKARALPPAAESSTALAPTGRKTGALSAAGESSTALTPTRSKAGLLGRATETSTALNFASGGLVQALPVAVCSDTAQGFVGGKREELPPAYEYSAAVTLTGGTPEGSDDMRLSDVMDEIATRLRNASSLAGRTYAYPPGKVVAPAAIVTYPTEYTYDLTYGRGMDRIKGQIVVVVGRPTERQSRDRLTQYADGAGPQSVKALVDGDDYTSCDTVRVESAEFDVFPIGGVDYLAAVFSVDIAGRGAQL